mgnify:CR=1 FL=1
MHINQKHFITWKRLMYSILSILVCPTLNVSYYTSSTLNVSYWAFLFPFTVTLLPKVSNFTTLSTMRVASSQMLEWVCESRGVLNLSQFESLDDWDERCVHLARGDDETSVTISFSLDDRWDICKITNT